MPTAAAVEHVVQRGETLGRIAAAYGVTVADLIAANNIANANLIRVGQRLVIPGTVAATATPATTAATPTTVAGTPTATRTHTPTPTPTLRPIQATLTAMAQRRTSTPTATPTPFAGGGACLDTLSQLIEALEERELPSGTSILTPKEWTAREVAGMQGSLPYLSDRRMSAIIYLVSGRAGSTDDRLDLVPTLAGVTTATELLRDVDGNQGLAVWDARVGVAHRLVAGFVTEEYTAVFAGSTVFCASRSTHSLAEAEELATLLRTVAESYQVGQ